MSKYLASNLRYLRKTKGKTQEQVKNEMQLGERVLSHYEKGSRGLDNELLVDFAKYYGVTVDDLLNVDLRSEQDKSKVVQLQNKYLKNDLIKQIQESDIWKQYQKKSEEREKLLQEHKDDGEWLYYDYLDREYEFDEAIKDQENQYDDSTWIELLTDGHYDALDYLFHVMDEMESMAVGVEIFDPITDLEYRLERIDKTMVYCAIARSLIKKELDDEEESCKRIHNMDL